MSVTHSFHKRFQSGLSLVELLIVVAIIGILGTAAAIAINPVELLKQARDGRRIADLQAIDRALGMYKQDGKSAFGDANTVYVSLVDTASSACASHNLPSLPSGWSYRCVTSEDALRKNDGTGWIPVDFTSISTGSSIPTLPVDPTNNASSGFYYAYVTGGGRWVLASLLESAKYLKDKAATDGGTDDGRLEIGSKLSLWSQASGLVGYWKFDEGTGTTARDYSGNNNNGTLVNGPTWTTGKVGGALSFDGVDDYVSVSDSNSLDIANAITIEAWVFWPVSAVKEMIVKNNNANNAPGAYELFQNTNKVSFRLLKGGVMTTLTSNTSLSLNVWHHILGIWNGSSMRIFIDGVGDSNTLSLTAPIDITAGKLTIGAYADSRYPLNGLIDEVRIYNRPLSDAEIKAIYDATK